MARAGHGPARKKRVCCASSRPAKRLGTPAPAPCACCGAYLLRRHLSHASGRRHPAPRHGGLEQPRRRARHPEERAAAQRVLPRGRRRAAPLLRATHPGPAGGGGRAQQRHRRGEARRGVCCNIFQSFSRVSGLTRREPRRPLPPRNRHTTASWDQGWVKNPRQSFLAAPAGALRAHSLTARGKLRGTWDGTYMAATVPRAPATHARSQDVFRRPRPPHGGRQPPLRSPREPPPRRRVRARGAPRRVALDAKAARACLPSRRVRERCVCDWPRLGGQCQFRAPRVPQGAGVVPSRDAGRHICFRTRACDFPLRRARTAGSATLCKHLTRSAWHVCHVCFDQACAPPMVPRSRAWSPRYR